MMKTLRMPRTWTTTKMNSWMMGWVCHLPAPAYLCPLASLFRQSPGSVTMSSNTTLSLTSTSTWSHSSRSFSHFSRHSQLVRSCFFQLFFLLTITLFSASTAATSSLSLHLSDSASQVTAGLVRPSLPLPQPRPVACPQCYSANLVWSWSKAMQDPAICVNDTNMYWPCMPEAIQDEDGNLISNNDWYSIHATAVVVVCTHLKHLDIKHYRSTFKKGCKALYKHFYKTEWDHAILKV